MTAADAGKSVDSVVPAGTEIIYNACFINGDKAVPYLATRWGYFDRLSLSLTLCFFDRWFYSTKMWVLRQVKSVRRVCRHFRMLSFYYDQICLVCGPPTTQKSTLHFLRCPRSRSRKTSSTFLFRSLPLLKYIILISRRNFIWNFRFKNISLNTNRLKQKL